MKNTDEVRKTTHSDGTIEMTWPDGSRVRIPQAARVSPENLKDALLCDCGEQRGKDIDLAHKIADAKSVKDIANAERSRLFSVLTDGGECPVPIKGAPSKAFADLRIAYEIRGINDKLERKERLKEAISAGRFIEVDAMNKRIKRIEKQWHALAHIEPELIGSFLQAGQDDDKLTYEAIRWLLSGIQSMYAINKSTHLD